MISEKVTKIAAGSYHSVALTASGKIYTWGYNGKYQLGRQGPSQDTPGLAKVEVELWYAFPGAIPGLGAAHGKTVIFVKPRPQTPKPQTQKPEKGPWADTKISWATTT